MGEKLGVPVVAFSLRHRDLQLNIMTLHDFVFLDSRSAWGVATLEHRECGSTHRAVAQRSGGIEARAASRWSTAYE